MSYKVIKILFIVIFFLDILCLTIEINLPFKL